MSQPHAPITPSDDAGSAATGLSNRTSPSDDEWSATSTAAERATAADHPSTTADVTENHAVAADAADTDDEAINPATPARRTKQRHVTTYVVVPLLVMCMAVGAGYLKYQDGSVRDAQASMHASVQAATDGTIAALSYNPDTVQTTLTAARDRMTGLFRDSYTSLINDVVIPGARQKKISATATVAAASSVMATDNHAVVLVFVDQSIIVGNDAPSASASAVLVTLDKTDGRWLISGFDPK